ncbi:hypothetical protein V8G54_023961 [Vigna mungo]|uniref:Uncharacterized protein n=1 Tax=Vigna mungo TaxID=3915 RepID=A0AAQ3N5L0_VIGMU
MWKWRRIKCEVQIRRSEIFDCVTRSSNLEFKRQDQLIIVRGNWFLKQKKLQTVLLPKSWKPPRKWRKVTQAMVLWKVLAGKGMDVFEGLRFLSEISNGKKKKVDNYFWYKVADACGVFPRPRWWPEGEDFDTIDDDEDEDFDP